jgi:hypothetical protein
MAQYAGSVYAVGRSGRMKAPAIRSYRCICEECVPLPPIEGLTAPVAKEPAPGAKGVLRKLTLRLTRSRGDNDA